VSEEEKDTEAGVEPEPAAQAGDESSADTEAAPEAAAPEAAPEADTPEAEAEATETGAPAAETEAEEPAASGDEGQSGKSDLPPGADLEPISVEPEAELSIEERARLEAEEEERRAAEAAQSEDGEEEEAPAPRAVADLAKDARYIATGKRKRSVARVIVRGGDGRITINDREIEEYFPRARHRTIVSSPLVATGYESNVEIRIRVHGGGISGQAGAVRHGIARALTEVDPELRGELKRRGFLTRDARAKERRKAGFKKARKKPQFSKR
jgi:small subunit ribosomal protein S9